MGQSTVRRFLAWLAVAAGLTAPCAAASPPATPAGNPPALRDGEARITSAPAIYLTGRINDHPVEMLLDSGATDTVVDKKFADSIGLQPSGTIRLRATNGLMRGGIASGVTISIGAFVLTGQKVVIADLSFVGTDRPLAMILGQNAFKAAVIDIDLPSGRIAFYKGAAYRPPRGAVPLKMTRGSHGVLYVPVSIEGKPIEAEFDLGQDSALVVSRGYSRKEKLLEGRRLSTTQISGAGGTSVWDALRVKSLSIAGVEFHDVPASVPRSDALLPGKKAVVGLTVWSRFHMGIDLGRKTLWLAPEPDAATEEFTRDRLGLATEREGDHLRVTSVAANSPAAAAGWKSGDVIAAIDGRRTDASFFDDRANLNWATGAPGASVSFTMADGSVRKLTRADYF